MTHWSGFDATADRRLLKRLAEGGESALADVYDIYAERLYDYALLFTGDVHVARDLVHDALIDASRRAPRLRDRRHLRPWLYGAVRRRGMARRRDTWSPPAVHESDPEELRVARTALAALDRGHRDALFLAYRHDLEGADLASTLGVSPRRARRRVARATSRTETEAVRAYAGTPPPDVPAAIELVRMLPAAEPPDILRDRVLHTAADPQLARYRKQIVSRGGRLIASGLPRQPDAPSQVARRYAVGGAAMAAFVGVVAIGMNVVDSGRGPWPGHPAPSWTTAPSIGTPGPHDPGPTPGHGDHPAALPSDRARHGNAPDGGKPTSTSRPSGRTPGARPPGDDDPPPPIQVTPTVPPAGQGTLTVRPSEIHFGTTSSTAVVTVTAENGPVRWTANTGTSVLSLSTTGGTLASGRTQRVTVRLSRNALLQLPGSSKITISGNGTHAVPVSWSISVLAR